MFLLKNHENTIQLAKKSAFFAILLMLSACSESSTKEEGGVDELSPSSEIAATTDAVPTEAKSPETPAPASDTATALPVAPDTPAQVSEPANGTEEYTVKRGDFLLKIAYQKYGDVSAWQKIYDQNRSKIQNPNQLEPGTILTLEKSSNSNESSMSERFKIRKGDTLAKISDEVYGTPRKWKKLWEFNKTLITNPNRIYAGFTLYYEMTPEEKNFRQNHQPTLQPSQISQSPADAQPQAQPETSRVDRNFSNAVPVQREPAAQKNTPPQPREALSAISNEKPKPIVDPGVRKDPPAQNVATTPSAQGANEDERLTP